MLDVKIAEKALVDITKVLEGFVGRKGYYIDSGTLLGFVRDNSINHLDHDIDIRILPEKLPEEKMPDLARELWQIGFDCLSSNVGRRAELICISNDTLLRLDLKFAYRDENLLWVYCWEQPASFAEPRVHVYPIRFFKKMGTIKYKGRVYPCPTPVEEYLTWHYGKDWKEFKANPKDAEMTDLKWDHMNGPPCSMSPSELMAKRKEIINYKKEVGVFRSKPLKINK